MFSGFRGFSLMFKLAGLSLLLACSAEAAYLRNVPQTLKQPDGTVFKCLASGDEHLNWLHDAGGRIIVQDQFTGFYVYAMRSGESLVPSKTHAGEPIPEGLDAAIGVPYSPEKMEQIRQNSPLRMPSPSEPSKAPKKGTLNNIVILIRFSDEPFFSVARSIYDGRFNTESESLKSYYQEVSYGQLTINSNFFPLSESGDIIESYQDSQPRGYYQPLSATNPIGYSGGNSGVERRNREHTLLKNAVDAVSPKIPADLVVDGDNDGIVDNVCFVVSGGATGWASLLWPHMWTLFSQTAYINGKKVDNYNFQLETSVSVYVLCHEMFHSLGSPDLYHYSQDWLFPVGPWDLMDYGSAHMCAYMKWKYAGWISSIPEITTPGTYTLSPLTSATNNCYKIKSPYTSTEYFVLEYRKQEGFFEIILPGAGLLIYRINSSCFGNSNGPPDEVYVYRPDGTTTTNGNLSHSPYSSEASRTAINELTNPMPYLTNGNFGGLRISNVGSAGDTISFDVDLALLTQVATPIFSPSGGNYYSTQSVNIQCGTPGAVIHYTTEDREPTESDPVVTGTLTVESSTSFRSKAWKTGMTPSDTNSTAYVITVGPVVFSDYGGSFETSNTVEMTCPTPGAVIHYTTDGTDPTEESPIIASGGSYIVERTMTLKARAFKTGWAPGDINIAEYEILAAYPVFTPAPGIYRTSQKIAITCSTPGASVHYTTDGAEPTQSHPVAPAELLIDKTTNLRVKAFKEGCSPSTTAYGLYKFPIRYHVKQGASGPVTDGLSWETAFPTLQQAALKAGYGDDVWVTAGTYSGNVSFTGGVCLYGGFTGTEMSLESRNWRVNRTLVEGDYTGAVLRFYGGNSTATTRVDGFTLTKGKGSGGGIYFYYAGQGVIENNIISGTQFLTASLGGGIYYNGYKAVIRNNVIIGNAANKGGGIYCNSANSVISGNVIAANTATDGSGICSNLTTAMTANTIVGNTGSSTSGAIYCTSNGSVVRNNILAFNSSGIYGTSLLGPPPTVVEYNCVFGNTGSNYTMVTPGLGNITVDPMLKDRNNGDYHLLASSPCIDAGIDTDLTPYMRDVDGHRRLIGSHVDIGAYEYADASTVFSTTGGFVKAKRWNLVSIPADPLNSDPLSVFAGIDIANANFQFWLNDRDGGGFQSYGQIFGWTGPIQRGAAYWFLDPFTAVDRDLSFEGSMAMDDFILTIPARSSAPFWIMFGTPFEAPILADNIRFRNLSKRGDVWVNWEEAFSQTDAHLRIVDSSAQCWDAKNNIMVNVTPSLWPGFHQFDPWKGYWLLVHDSSELQIKFSTP